MRKTKQLKEMKKKFLKSFVAFAAVAVAGLGSYKAYGSYLAANMSEEDLLLAENIEALGQLIESSENEYRTIEDRQPCFHPEEKLLDCPRTEGEHLDTYLRSYEEKGEHYTCKVHYFIPVPWMTKPDDQCRIDKKCSAGTVPENKVPYEYKDGKTIEVFKDHTL